MGVCRINESVTFESHTKNTREARAKPKNTNRTPKHKPHSKNTNHTRRKLKEPRASCAKSVINESINIRLEKSLALTHLANARILLALARVLLALARVSPRTRSRFHSHSRFYLH